MKRYTLITCVRWVIKIILIVLFGYLVVFALSRFSDFGQTDIAIEEAFTKSGVGYTVSTYNQGKNRIHFASVGEKSRPMVLFIHDAPGDWSTFLQLLADKELADQKYLVAVDRPGYGTTEGPMTLSLKKQVEAFAPMLSLASGKVTLVGHGYGAAIATEIARARPDKVASLILVAPNISPEGEVREGWKEFGITLSKIPLFHQLLNPAFVTASSELDSLPDEIREVESEFGSIALPVTVISGKRDLVSSITNVEYVSSYFTGAEVATKQISAGHLIPQNHSYVIKDTILSQPEIIPQ